VTGTGPIENEIVGRRMLGTKLTVREDDARTRAEASNAICDLRLDSIAFYGNCTLHRMFHLLTFSLALPKARTMNRLTPGIGRLRLGLRTPKSNSTPTLDEKKQDLHVMAKFEPENKNKVSVTTITYIRVLIISIVLISTNRLFF
jgi:hypothetical protein